VYGLTDSAKSMKSYRTFSRDGADSKNIYVLPPSEGEQMASLFLSRFTVCDSVSRDWNL
jgi:hypothetical protein